ncbi:hypothetical protein BC629DRAFT_189966 [Irpex lacteus]|nr:hypothetical protein BC629DRAFT_189966 [Irpex lacteus]
MEHSLGLYISTLSSFSYHTISWALRCKSLTSLVVLYTIVTTFGTNTYLTLRHVQAWDGRRAILYMFIGALVATHLPAIALGIMSMKEMFENTTYVPALRTCGILVKTNKLGAAWACVVAYDTIAIALSVINVLDRPRRRDADVITYMKGDGAPFFIIVFVLRYVALGLILRLPAGELFLPALYVFALIIV